MPTARQRSRNRGLHQAFDQGPKFAGLATICRQAGPGATRCLDRRAGLGQEGVAKGKDALTFRAHTRVTTGFLTRPDTRNLQHGDCK